MPPVFLEHPSSLRHDTGAHPEQPARIVAIEQELDRSGWFGFERRRSEAADQLMLTAVHTERHVDAVERLCASGGGEFDLDTVVSRDSYEAALYAAGGAVGVVDLLLSREAPYAISVHRPPGHHATPGRAMGFCLFNNVAIAAQHALNTRGLQRVLILDWDVHHGNGTNDIFHDSQRVLYVSIHQSPLYPGTGSSRDIGSGVGEGFTVNLPVAAGSGDLVFTSMVEHVVVPLVHSYAPQLVLISAGYDAHREEPLADCEMTEQGYAAMTRAMLAAATAVGAPLGFVLEGGYALRALGRSVAATMQALAEPANGEPATPTPDAFEARRRLAAWWPELV